MVGIFISRKSCKTCENTVKSLKFLLVLICGEQQIKQVNNYKWLQTHIQACETHLDTQTLSRGSLVHADISASLPFKDTLYTVYVIFITEL